MSAPVKTFADYETPLVTLCLDDIAHWAGKDIEALRNTELSEEAATNVIGVIVSLNVEIDAHRQAFAQMED